MYTFATRPRLFLSFAREDQTAADALRQELSARGAEVWTPDELNAVARTASAVEEAMRRSDAVLVLLSQASVKSPWVASELKAAMDATRAPHERVKVVPVAIEGANALPDIGSLRYLDASNHDWADLARRLLASGGPIEATAPESSAVDDVIDAIRDLPLEIVREPVAWGVRPDIVVETDNRRRAVLEVKARSSPSLVEAIQARAQAARLAEATAADLALVVYPRLEGSLEHEGIVGTLGLRHALRRLIALPRIASPPEDVRPPSGIVFAAMPFAPEYGDVYWVAMRAAAQALGLACVKVDEEDYVGDIVVKIKSLITESVAVIGDLSEAKPNVLYELGFAHALDRPTVHICATPLDQLPFDVRNWNTLEYGLGQTHRLIEPLTRRLRSALDGRVTA